MKTASSTSYRVSNNFSTTTRSGRVSGGAGARSKDEESPRNASKRGSKANAEAPEAMLAGTAGAPAKQAKRRDQKATPDSHAITKAKEMATRKDGNPTAGTAPITVLTGGSGGTGQERAPLGRDDLASASKVLFGDVAEEKQTQGTPKSFLQYDTEEEALEAAVAEVKAAEESAGEAAKDADEGSGIDAGKPSAKAKGSIVGNEQEDAGRDDDAELDQDEQEDGAEGVDRGMPMVFSPSKTGRQIWLSLAPKDLRRQRSRTRREYNRLSAIRKALDTDSTFSSRSSQFDLLSAIESVLLELPIQVHWRHVDGHQDDGRIGPLDRWEQLNCEMDALAKLRWQTSAATHVPFHEIDGQLWPLFLNVAVEKIQSGLRRSVGGRAVGHELPARLADHTLGKHLLRYWEDKSWLGDSTSPRINWDAVGLARSSLSMSKKAWVSKFVSGHCAVNARLKQRDQVDSDLCPRCLEAIETPDHVLSCRYGDPCFDKCTAVLCQWGRKSGAAPGLMETVIEGLSNWRRQPQRRRPRPLTRARTPALQVATRDQDNIGWGSMLMGFHSREWERIQSEHFRNQGSLRSGRRWVVELLKKLWNTSWDLWMTRNYQLKSGHDEEAMGLLMMLDRHILHLLGQGTQYVPQELLPLLRCSPHHLLRRPVEAKLAWIDKIQLGREYLLGRQAPPAIRGYYRRRFINGGLLARLRRSKSPPTLRTTDRAPPKALLDIDRDDE